MNNLGFGGIKFKIPKKNQSSDSNQEIDQISSSIKQKYSFKSSSSVYSFKDFYRINLSENQKLFDKRKSKFSSQVGEDFAFYPFTSYDAAQKLIHDSKKGVKCNNHKDCLIGAPDKGVTLFKYSDIGILNGILSSRSCSKIFILIFKFLLSPVYYIEPDENNPKSTQIQPQIHFGYHTSKWSPSSCPNLNTMSLSKITHLSHLYFYEHDEYFYLAEAPSNILPVHLVEIIIEKPDKSQTSLPAAILEVFYSSNIKPSNQAPIASKPKDVVPVQDYSFDTLVAYSRENNKLICQPLDNLSHSFIVSVAHLKYKSQYLPVKIILLSDTDARIFPPLNSPLLEIADDLVTFKNLLSKMNEISSEDGADIFANFPVKTMKEQRLKSFWLNFYILEFSQDKFSQARNVSNLVNTLVQNKSVLRVKLGIPNDKNNPEYSEDSVLFYILPADENSQRIGFPKYHFDKEYLYGLLMTKKKIWDYTSSTGSKEYKTINLEEETFLLTEEFHKSFGNKIPKGPSSLAKVSSPKCEKRNLSIEDTPASPITSDPTFEVPMKKAKFDSPESPVAVLETPKSPVLPPVVAIDEISPKLPQFIPIQDTPESPEMNQIQSPDEEGEILEDMDVAELCNSKTNAFEFDFTEQTVQKIVRTKVQLENCSIFSEPYDINIEEIELNLLNRNSLSKN